MALLRAGASLTIQDREGLTPLDLVRTRISIYGCAGLPTASVLEQTLLGWGDNANYALGLGSGDRSIHPAPIVSS